MTTSLFAFFDFFVSFFFLFGADGFERWLSY